MSDPQLLEGEAFFVDPMELVELRKEVRRLNNLIANKDEIQEKTIEAMNREIECLKEERQNSPVIKLKEPIGFSVCLLNIISFLLLWKEVVFFQKKGFEDRPEIDARKLVNVVKAIDTFFAPYIEAVDNTNATERLFALVDYLQEEVFVFAEGKGQKLGATADFTNSPIRALESNSKKFYEDTWKARREDKKKKKKPRVAAKKPA